MRMNGLEELILTGSIHGNRSMGKTEREKYLTNLSIWVTEQLKRRENDKVKEINLLRTPKDVSMWKSMMAHALNGHGS